MSQSRLDRQQTYQNDPKSNDKCQLHKHMYVNNYFKAANFLQGVFDTESMNVDTSVSVDTSNLDNNGNNNESDELFMFIVIGAAVALLLFVIAIVWCWKKTTWAGFEEHSGTKYKCW